MEPHANVVVPGDGCRLMNGLIEGFSKRDVFPPGTSLSAQRFQRAAEEVAGGHFSDGDVPRLATRVRN